MNPNEFLCTEMICYNGKMYMPGDKIILKEPQKERAPIYLCFRSCEYKGVKYGPGEFGYFPDEIPPSDFFVHLHDADKYELKYIPFGKIYVRKEK